MRVKIYAKIRFGHFYVFLLLSSVICRPVHLFNTSCGLKVLIKKGLIKKIYLGKNLVEQLFTFTLDTPPYSHFFTTTKTSHVCK